MGKRNVVLSFLKVLEKWIKCWLKQIEAAIHVGRMWGKIYSFILQSVWGELEETELSQGCLPGHRGSCLNLQISKVFLFLFFFVLLQQRGLWCDRANTSTFSILVHPYVSCPSCTCPRVDLQQPEHASTACLPAAQPSSCSPPHHLLDILYALDKLPVPNPPPANVYWSKHKYGCGKGI